MYIQKFTEQFVKQAIKLDYDYCNCCSDYKYPNITGKQIQEKYDNLTPEQRDDLILTYYG